jgi:SAM-dependent methyltransferase
MPITVAVRRPGFLFPLSGFADRYARVAYHFPNDEPELERQNNQHDIIGILLDGRKYLAPLSRDNPPRKILDIATGTGLWAIEMGDEFPHSSVIGTDLSPIQPELVPPNVRFYIDDRYAQHRSSRSLSFSFSLFCFVFFVFFALPWLFSFAHQSQQR